MRKCLYLLADYLHARGYLVGILEETKNEWYDIGFEDGYALREAELAVPKYHMEGKL